jgi:release factor glutamine methyltransferase
VNDAAWTVAQVLERTAGYLRDHGSADPRLEAELLLAHTLGLSRLELYVHHDRRLSVAESERYKARARRRAAGEPVQYVLGEAAFRHLILRVTPDVLIPRPETERLVDEILEWIAGSGLAGPRLLDVGTGSGAIALACLQEIPGSTALGTDVSEAALRIAAANAEAAGLADRLDLRRGELFEPLEPHEVFDVVAANLPYVSGAELRTLAREVRDFEPEAALLAGEGGTEVVERLVAQAPPRLRPGGLLVCEIAPSQAETLRRSVEATPGLRYIAGYRDHAGRERGFLATRVPPPN